MSLLTANDAVVRVAREERVLRLTLNRPEKRNALNSAMCNALVDAVTQAQNDSTVGAILMDANGRVFCSGMDLDEAVATEGVEHTAIHEELFALGRKSRKPIVMCVNGPALGGGLGLVVQAHVAVAAQGALFGLTEIRTGMWPFLVYRSIEAAVGARRALELSLTGRLFSTQEALGWGVVHQVAHAFEVEERAETIARDLAKASPTAVALGMEYVHSSRCKTWSQAGDIAIKLRAKSMVSADFKEGVRAFHAKVEPHWPSMPSGAYANEAQRPPVDLDVDDKPHIEGPE